MFGLIVGSIGAYGLYRTLRGGGHCGRHGGPMGRGFDRGYGRGFGGGFGGGGFVRGPLRWAFERLDTGPGQERVIKQAVEALWSQKRQMKDQASRLRSELGELMTGESLDEQKISDMRQSLSRDLETAMDAVEKQLRVVFDVLEPQQRQELARWLGQRRSAGGGPYRQPEQSGE